MLGACLIAPATVFSQEKTDSAEHVTTVPELDAFHDVIHAIWHDAYPEKDIAALKGFVQQLNEHMDALNKAELPPTLKDKETEWNKQLADMNAAVENYTKAAAGEDADLLLSATVKLHDQFRLMRQLIGTETIH
jgi:RecB family exonuclease